MTAERFEQLAEAYGSDVSRWPVETWDAAAALMASEPAMAQAVLARAARLDDVLDTAAFVPASRGLAERILAGAPQRRRTRWTGWLLPAGLTASLAAICAAGVFVGAQAAPATTGDPGETITAAVVDLDVSGLPEEV